MSEQSTIFASKIISNKIDDEETLIFSYQGLRYTISLCSEMLSIEVVRKRDYCIWHNDYQANEETGIKPLMGKDDDKSNVKYTPNIIFTMLKDFVYNTLKKNTQIKFSNGNLLDTENIIVSIETDLGYSGMSIKRITIIPKKISEEEKHKKVAAYLEGKNLKLNNKLISLEDRLSSIEKRISVLESK
jgi:hypothetical protein